MLPVIIEAALNGERTKALNPNVPKAADEIVAQAIEAVDAGAAIVHTHCDSIALNGEAAVASYRKSYDRILAARPGTILSPTVARGETVEERFGHYRGLAAHGIRMASLDPGSVNLAATGPDGFPLNSFVYATSYNDVAGLNALLDETRLGPSIAIYEPGWLRTVLAYRKAGRLARGAFVKLYFCGGTNFVDGRPTDFAFGLPPTEKALEAYLELLEGSGLPWAVAAIGDCVMRTGLARMALARGGHVRVGIEDFGGARQPTNLELVREVAALATETGRPVASPEEAARILDLPR